MITWILHSNLHDAFLIWVLAYDFNAKISNINNKYYMTGRIKAVRSFIKYLCKEMDCTESTAKKRLNRAIKHRFLLWDDNQILLVGSKKLLETAFFQQSRAYSDKRSSCEPTFFFRDDRSYTVRAGDIVSPKSLGDTKSLLYGIVSVYGNRYLWSRGTHSNILRMDRRSIIRLFKKSNTKAIEQYLCIDPFNLLYKPKCNRVQAIEAFITAENLYRKGSKTRGRSVIHRRTIPDLGTNSKTCLTLQLPNLYISSTITREVPASTPGFVVNSLSRFGMTGSRAKPISSCVGLDTGYSPDQRLGRRGKHKELPAGSRKFMDAQRIGEIRELSGTFTARYLDTLNQILDDERCQEYILDTTEAEGILPLSHINPVLYRGKIDRSRVTPYMLSEYSRAS